MLGFLRKHLHKHVRGNIHRPWMQWSIRIYEGVTTFLHGLLWFTGLLFLSGHIAASAVQAGYHLTNVWSHADRIVAMDLGHMGWQELLALFYRGRPVRLRHAASPLRSTPEERGCADRAPI